MSDPQSGKPPKGGLTYREAGVDIDAGENVYVVASTHDHDIAVAKYTSLGGRQWFTTTLSTDGWDGSGDLAADTAGNVYVTGWTDGDLDGEANAGGRDILVTKVNTYGIVQWAHLLGTSTYEEYGLGIAVDPSGNVYVTGYTSGDLSGEINNGKEDAFLTKYDGAGNWQWTRLLGTGEWDRGYDVAADELGRVYVTGQTWGNLGGHTAAGEFDVFVAQYDGGGVLQCDGRTKADRGTGTHQRTCVVAPSIWSAAEITLAFSS